MLSIGQMTMRLLVSAFLGGIIGFEREKSNRPAGFRTHILVTLGSTLMALISIYALNPMTNDNDPMRLAAQVVSGIGFLGAGTVIKDGSTVRGLTTAAGIWVCGGIGLAVGVGMYEAGIITVIIAFFSLTILNRIEKQLVTLKFKNRLKNKFKKSEDYYLSSLMIVRDTNYGLTKDIEILLEQFGYYVEDITFIKEEMDPKTSKFILSVVKVDEKVISNPDNCIMKLKSLPGIKEIKLDY